MRKQFFLLLITAFSIISLQAQDKENEEEKEKIPFKQNLFAGGSISAGFSTRTFLAGVNPVFGYSLTNWADVALVANYTYTSFRDVSGLYAGDKLRQTVYGGGAFLRLYPVRFLFAQAQVEQNFIRQKYIDGSYTEKSTIDATSLLLGAGYTSGRQGRGGRPFFYLSLLFDVSGNDMSPYTNASGRAVPVVRAGIQVPLFQPKNDYDY